MSTKLMTVKETAKQLGTPVSTLRQWVRKGTAPPSRRIGRRRMFRDIDVEQWIVNQFQPNNQEEK